MSKASAHAAIKHSFFNAVPAINPDIVRSEDSIEEAAEADEAHRAIVRLQKLRDTKEIQYKSVADKMRQDRQETLDAIDTMIHILDSRLKEYAKPRLEGRHLDLPSGRIQFNATSSVAIKDLGDVELEDKLQEVSKVFPDLVRVKRELVKKEAKRLLSIPEAAEKLDWLSLESGDSVSYSEDTISAPPELSREEAEASRAAAASADSPPADDALPEKKVEEKPETDDPPSGVDLTKAPRIFEVPEDHHFTDEKLKGKAGTFLAMDVEQLLKGQSRVTLDHVKTLPIDKIKGGMVSMMGKLGMGRAEVRKWVAYHTGQTQEQVDPGKLEDSAWRRLLALSVHAHTVMEKHKAG